MNRNIRFQWGSAIIATTALISVKDTPPACLVLSKIAGPSTSENDLMMDCLTCSSIPP